MNPNYEPRPGTVAARAVAWLETQPLGAEFTISALAEGCSADASNLRPNLLAAVENGLIERRVPKGQSRPWLHRLAAHRHPGASATSATPEVERTVPQPESSGAIANIASTLGARASARSEPAAKRGTASMLRIGLFSDGALHIERQGETLVLLPQEAHALRRFLATVHEVPA